MKARTLLLAGVVLLLLFISPVGQAQEPDHKIRERALSMVARAKGVHPSVLEVVYQEQVAYSLTGGTVHRVKIWNPLDESVHLVTLDNALATIDEAVIQSREQEAYIARYGKLQRELYDLIHGQASDARGTLLANPTWDVQADLIDVAIWANSDFGESTAPGPYWVYLPLVLRHFDPGLPPPEALTAQEQVVRYLTDHGYEPTYVSSESPMVFASLPSDVITDLQAQSYVAAICLQDKSSLSLWSAVRTAAAPWTWERGITGSGVKVAVVEMDGVAFDNPYVSGSKYYIGWWPRVGDHATQVAGAIASRHSTNRGVAYDAEILSANGLAIEVGDGYFFPDWSAVAATDWAIEQGANVINCSFGAVCDDTNIASLDKYYDWVTWNRRKTVTVAAGNVHPSCSSNHNVGTPGKGYNVISVGSKDDMNTATTESDVNDDTFSWFSLYIDPTTQSDARLKPEVIATGERIRSTIASNPWIDSGEVAGTSFAAPIVAGEAALMMHRASWLKDFPEAVKAGIMATARWTRVHDDSGSGYASQDKIGEGAVDTTAADNSLINNRIQGVTLRKSDFTDNHYDFYFHGLKDQRIRVVIVWSSHPARLGWTPWVLFDSLESDFDLTVSSPSGSTWGSYAHERNYEIVEFMAPETGSYRARVHLSRWDWTNQQERIGFAWYSGFPLP